MAIDWLFVERGTSHSISNSEPAGASIITRRFFMRDQASQAVTEDVLAAIGQAPPSHPEKYELGLRVGSPMNLQTSGTDYDEWFDGDCPQVIAGTGTDGRPNPIVTSINVTPVRESPYAWEIEVRAEVFWPATYDADSLYGESTCYSGQYRRFTTTNSIRQMKLFRVKDVSAQAPDDEESSPAAFQWTGWIPTADVGGTTVYGQPNNYWLTRDNTVTPAIGGTADPADWIGLDAGGSTVSFPVNQRTWTVSIVTSNWLTNAAKSNETFGLDSFAADQFVNARSYTQMFGAPPGMVKFDGVNVSPMNKYWCRLDFRWTFDALAFMEQMPAKNSNGSPYVEPTPVGVTDPVLHAYCRWYQPFPFLMNTTAASDPSGPTTKYTPLNIIPDQNERFDVKRYIDEIGTSP